MKRFKILLFVLFFSMTLVGCQSDETTTEEQVTTNETTQEVTTAVPTYTVTKVLGMGMADEVIEGKVGGDVVTLFDLTLEGYTFIDWYESSDFSGTAITEVTVGTSDVTVYAKWEINTYNVSFNTNGGSSVNPAQYDYGETIVRPADPERDNYEFVGWYETSAFDTEFVFGAMPAEDVVAHAKWELTTYTVTFLDSDDSYITSQEVEHGSDAIAPSDPVAEGQIFAGWDVSFTNVTSDLTVRATYDVIEYTVRFYTEGGTLISEELVVYSSGATAPADPTKVGYTFDGWNQDYSEVYNDLDIYPIFTINQYTVSFNADGGDAVASVTVDYDTVISLPETTKVDNYFQYWEYNSVEVSNSYTVTGDVTLTAVWKDVLADFTYGDNVTYIYITKYNGSDSEVIIPDTYGGAPITIIGTSAFLNNDSLEKITIGNNIIDIYNSAFSNCTGLREIIFKANSSLQTIGNQVFANCTSLETINLSDCSSLISIGLEAFYNTTGLDIIYLPISVTTLGLNTFLSCDNLRIVVEAESTEDFGGSNFNPEGCPVIYGAVDTGVFAGLDYVEINDSTITILKRIKGSVSQSILVPDTINSLPVTKIADYAFADTDILDIMIGINVLEIGIYAFSDCNFLMYVSIESGSALETIGEFAFASCLDLQNIQLENVNTLDFIGQYAFSSCPQLNELQLWGDITTIEPYINNGSEQVKILVEAVSRRPGWSTTWVVTGTVVFDFEFNFIENNLMYAVQSDGDCVLYGLAPGVTITSLVVPNIANEYPVNIIAGYAFYQNGDLEHVVIADSLSIIERMAFYDCDSLVDVLFNSGSQLENIGLRSFGNSGLLATINLEVCENLTTIQYAAFAGSGLTDVIILDNVTSIASQAFFGIPSTTVIHCEVASIPAGWDPNWNYSNNTVDWGYVLPV